MLPLQPQPLSAKDLQGFKYLNEVLPLLQRLHSCGTNTDKAGNRRFFADHYVALLLLYFFNPVLTSRNALLQASRLDKVQAFCGGRAVSAGSFSEAQHLFDPALLEGLVRELAQRVPDAQVPKDWDCLKNLTAVDGSLLPALPRMVWALWLDDDHKAAKMHVHFEVLRGIPIQATVTTGNDSEKQPLRQTLEKDRLYVIDRGYAEYQLFQDILDAGGQFVGRIRDNAVWEVIEQRPVSVAAWAAGVRSDRLVWLGCEQSKKALRQAVRVLEVATGKVDREGRPEVLLLASSCLEMLAEWDFLLWRLFFHFWWTIEECAAAMTGTLLPVLHGHASHEHLTDAASHRQRRRCPRRALRCRQPTSYTLRNLPSEPLPRCTTGRSSRGRGRPPPTTARTFPG